jgi:hypothetical protein
MGNSSISITEPRRQIYWPSYVKSDWLFEKFVGHERIRYFSYGRHALAEGFLTIGIEKGDKILVPSYICRDLLSSIHSVGASPVYYDIDKELQPATPVEYFPLARAVIAVNYFGFPCDLNPFKDYCRRSGAILFEDNAHGLFSRDEKGRILGTRGDIGIFSLRKTILLPDGAAMVLNLNETVFSLRPQLKFSTGTVPLSFLVKNFLLKSAPLRNLELLRLLIYLKRLVRSVRTGHKILPSSPEAEFVLPADPSPNKNLYSLLARLDIGHEISRRRALYNLVDMEMRRANYQPVFPALPDYVTPYCYPFFSDKDRIGPAKKALRKIHLECHPWPELPAVVFPNAPDHYKTIWMVGFLW